MPNCFVNGKEVAFEPGMTVLQACEIAGEEIPRFCYHERLKIAGNCRMCLVQIEGGPPKPAASCAMPAGEGMKIHTNTPMVKKAREGVMEFLLINHPLDCPICDQAGECDLQDQAMTYGRGHNRFEENKRSVKDKYLGPLVETNMTRCIHCTRCVRFMDEVAGVSQMGATGRGEDMEVGTFIQQGITSELSGNIVDLCPVGALTSKPYAFTARSWELKHTESIDVLDAVGSNIRIDTRGKEVMRILPRINEAVNEEWISDKTRHACDGLKTQRLDRPYIRKGKKLVPASWEEALSAVKQALTSNAPKEIGAIAGDLADAESMFMLKALFDELGSSNYDCRQDGAEIDAKNRASYLFNSTIEGIEQADALLIVGANPRVEASILNARIRKRYIKGNFPIALIGEKVDLTYKYDHLGEAVDELEALATGSHPFAKILKSAKKPMVIVGSGVLTRSDAEAIGHLLSDLVNKLGIVKDGWNGYNQLHTAASRVGGLELGFVPQEGGKNVNEMLAAARKGSIKTLYLLGADEIDFDGLDETFIIYQGHHGDAGAMHADVILPSAAYTEKDATYVNLEGRAQRAYQAIFPLGEAKEDWLILRDVHALVGVAAKYGSLAAIRAQLEHISSVFANVDEVVPAKWKNFGKNGKFLKAKFEPAITNFYMTDPISRASKTMAACVDELVEGNIPVDEKVA